MGRHVRQLRQCRAARAKAMRRRGALIGRPFEMIRVRARAARARAPRTRATASGRWRPPRCVCEVVASSNSRCSVFPSRCSVLRRVRLRLPPRLTPFSRRFPSPARQRAFTTRCCVCVASLSLLANTRRRRRPTSCPSVSACCESSVRVCVSACVAQRCRCESCVVYAVSKKCRPAHGGSSFRIARATKKERITHI